MPWTSPAPKTTFASLLVPGERSGPPHALRRVARVFQDPRPPTHRRSVAGAVCAMSALAVRATSDALKMRTLRVPVRAIAPVEDRREPVREAGLERNVNRESHQPTQEAAQLQSAEVDHR